VEVAGAEALEEGASLLLNSKEAHLVIMKGFVEAVPDFVVAAQKLANWATVQFEKPVATVSDSEMKAMKDKIEELTKELDAEKAKGSKLNAALKRKAENLRTRTDSRPEEGQGGGERHADI
jgi:ABC-type Fe3+-hydroxamate transport system substrate-binding protein